MKASIAKAVFQALLLCAVFAIPANAEMEQKNPYARADGTWISISGTVETVSPNTFRLDYGEGSIIVEMDDGDRDADAYKLVQGDKVTVNGRIDDDFYETTTIEASSVYVEKLGTYFFASARDEEDADLLFFGTATPVVVSSGVVHGTVTKVSGDEFTLDLGARTLTVDVEEMGYDPLDDEGYQRIRVGDFVRVSGRVDDGLFEGRKLVADSVIKLSG